jgi:hypothetical protein
MSDKDFVEYVVDEVRINRTAIERVGDKLDGKVGRGELFGWFSVIGAVVSAVIVII